MGQHPSPPADRLRPRLDRPHHCPPARLGPPVRLPGRRLLSDTVDLFSEGDVMKSTPSFAFWQAVLARPGARRRRPTARGPGRTRRALVLEALEDRILPAATTTIGALGDSITAPYPPQAPWGLHGDQSWAQQLDGQGYKHLRIENAAVPGATSSDLLSPGGQVAVMAHLVSSGAVQYVTL